MVETAVTQAVQRAFKTQQKMLWTLIALLGTFGAALLAFIFRDLVLSALGVR